MALKDLIAERAKITENQIEEIVAEYARYDTDEREVVHTPAFAALSNKGKVLVHLVALQGWPFVAEETVPADASPAELEEALHIPGGTLRPILKDLKDRHIIATRGRKYSVSIAALEAIKAEIASRGDGAARTTAPRRRMRQRSRGRVAKGDGGGKPKRGSSTKTRVGDRTKKFDAWIKKGFFDSARTLNEVHRRFHEEADIVSKTSLPGYLLAAVKDGRLSRKKAEVGGRQVWVYESRSKTSA